jgi:hypothetical protein
MNEVITVEQSPVIKYDLLKQISEGVKAKIESLNLDALVASEETLTDIKNIRAELNKDFKSLEEQRKLVKEIVLKDYNKFEDEYKKLISSQFSEADNRLKSLAQTVDDEILARKITGIEDYFEQKNTYDFIKFADVGLHIIKSKADKAYQTEIDEYLAKVANDLQTISTVSYEDRVLAKYQIFKDLNRAISEVNIEVQREDAIKAKQREDALRADEQVKVETVIQDEPAPVSSPKVEPEIPAEKEQIFKATFTVFGTKNQLRKLKEFMISEGIKYE